MAATCNLKVKHGPSGSAIAVYLLMGTLQTGIQGAQLAVECCPSPEQSSHRGKIWEMAVDMDPRQNPVFAWLSQRASDLSLNPFETCTETRHVYCEVPQAYFNCNVTQALGIVLRRHLEYVYTWVSVSHVSV